MKFQIPKSFTITTLIIVFLSLSTTISALRHQPPPPSPPANAAAQPIKPFIRKACKTTPYPRLCETSITFYTSSKTKQTQQNICAAALNAAIKSAKNATSIISKLSTPQKSQPSLSPYEAEVIGDCVETLKDSIDELQNAASTIKNLSPKSSDNNDDDVEFLIDGVKTWVSAAETNVVTCTDGLEESDSERRMVRSKVKSFVKMSVLDVTRKISNALSLVNNFKIKS